MKYRIFSILLAQALGTCSIAMAGVDNVVVAASEASGSTTMGISAVFGALGAAWLGWAGREDGQALTGAAVGFALGSGLGLVAQWILF